MTSIDQNLVNAWSTGGRPLLAKEPKVAGGQRLTEPQVMTASDKEVRMRCAACRDGVLVPAEYLGTFSVG